MTKPVEEKDRKDFRAFFTKRFLTLLLLGILITTSGMMLLYGLESKAVQSSIVSNSNNLAALHKKHIEGILWQVRSDLAYLTAEVEGLNVNVSSVSAGSDRLLNLCQLFMREKPIYDQIRIINTSGMEVLRINLKPDGPEHVPPDELQNKSGRYYVKAALTLSHGEVYVSSLDLNMEHGAIELPPKPVLRFAMPVFANGERMQGIVILNLLGNILFQDLLTSESRFNIREPVPLQTMMIDSNGYWLFNPADPSKEFGFMYPDKKNVTMAFEYPEEWKALYREAEGEYLGPDGLYIFKTVNTSLDVDGMVAGPGHPWKVVVFTSTPSLAKTYGTLQKKFLIPYAVLVSLLAVVSWFLADAQTRNRIAEAKIVHLAHHDHLTGLANRLLFHDLAEFAISTAERNNQQLALLFLDLDRFKLVNDKLGHAAGDAVLKEAATRIQGCIRKPDVVARLGGDEFAVILQDIDGPSGALKVGQKIVNAVSLPVIIKGTEQSVGVSIGISIYPQDGGDIDSLLIRADHAMYRAKGFGGNRSIIAG